MASSEEPNFSHWTRGFYSGLDSVTREKSLLPAGVEHRCPVIPSVASWVEYRLFVEHGWYCRNMYVIGLRKSEINEAVSLGY